MGIFDKLYGIKKQSEEKFRDEKAKAAIKDVKMDERPENPQLKSYAIICMCDSVEQGKAIHARLVKTFGNLFKSAKTLQTSDGVVLDLGTIDIPETTYKAILAEIGAPSHLEIKPESKQLEREPEYSVLHGMCTRKELYENTMYIIRRNADKFRLSIKVEGRRGKSSAEQYAYWIVPYAHSSDQIHVFWDKVDEFRGHEVHYGDTFGPNLIHIHGYPNGFFDSELLETIYTA